MPALPGCTIADTDAALGPDGLMRPRSGTVVATASVTPLFVQQQGGTFVEHAHTLVSAVESTSGSWTLVLPAQDHCDPASVTWTITLPDGTAWNGAVSAAMVTASQAVPLSVHDLKVTYGWGLVAGAAGGAVSAVAGLGVGAPATYWVSIPPSGTVTAYNAQKGTVDASGATSDVVLSALFALLGSTPATVSLSPQTHILAAGVTIPTTVGLVVPQGALLSYSTHALTIDGPLDAGPYHIFSGTGPVTLGPGSVAHIYAEWWGITGTGDDVAINAALLCAAGGGLPSCGLVQLLAKTYQTSGTINPQPGVTLAGQGSSLYGIAVATSIECSSTTVPVITLPSSGGPVRLRDFDTRGGQNSISSASSYLIFLENLCLQEASGVGILVNGGCERWFVNHVSIAGPGSHGLWFQKDSANTNFLDKSHFLFLQVARPGGNGIRIECRGFNDTFENVNLTMSLQHAWYLDNTLVDLLILNPNHESTGFSPNKQWCYTTGSITMGSTQLTVASTANLSVGDTVSVLGAGGTAQELLSSTVSAISGTTVTLSSAAGGSVSGAYVTNALYDEFYFAGVINRVSNVTIINAAVGYDDSGGWANGVRFIVYGGGVYSGTLINVTSEGSSPIYDPFGYFTLVGSCAPTGKRTRAYSQSGVIGQSADDDLWISVRDGHSAQVHLVSDGNLGYGSFVLSRTPYNAQDPTPSPTLFAVVGGDGTMLSTRTAPVNGVYTIPSATTTPDVSQSDILLTGNSVPTTISGFSNAPYPGQRITLLFGDAQTTLQHGGSIWLKSGANLTGTLHQALDLVYTGSVWVEPGVPQSAARARSWLGL